MVLGVRVFISLGRVAKIVRQLRDRSFRGSGGKRRCRFRDLEGESFNTMLEKRIKDHKVHGT